MSEEPPLCPVIGEDGLRRCPAGLAVPRGTVLTRSALRSVAYLVLLGLLVTAANLVLTGREIGANNRKFCDVVHGVTDVPVAKPADPAANPSRAQNYEWYLRFVNLDRSLGCG